MSPSLPPALILSIQLSIVLLSSTFSIKRHHAGPVLTVRWAHHGRYLASGSDDGVVLIWDLDPSGGGKVWGSSDVNVESWKPLKRLVGHENDVADVAWSSDDSMIASVGLDSKIFIWDGYTFGESAARLHLLLLLLFFLFSSSNSCSRKNAQVTLDEDESLPTIFPQKNSE